MRNFYRAHFLGVEFLISIVITMVIFVFLNQYAGFNVFESNLEGIRDVLYGTLAALSGALLGFVITGLSVLLTSSSNEQIEKLKRSRHYKTIFKVFFSTSKYLGILLIVSLLCLIFDKDSSPVLGLTFICVWAVIIVALRILRCIWVLEKIIQLHILK